MVLDYACSLRSKTLLRGQDSLRWMRINNGNIDFSKTVNRMGKKEYTRQK